MTVGPPCGRAPRVAVGVAALAMVLAACGPTPPVVSPSAPASDAPPASATPATSPDPLATTPAPTATSIPVDPGAARLVWTVDAAGGGGIWTTDLAGGDVRTLVAGLGDTGGTIRDATIVGDAVVYLRDSPAGPRLWIVGPETLATPVIDGVVAFVVDGDGRIVAARDAGASIELLGLGPLGPGGTIPGSPARIGSVSTVGTVDTSIGPFGLAVSPDGRWVAAGWVGGRVDIHGPTWSTLRDVGAPLAVGDDGTLLATVGRAGEAYRLEAGDPPELVELASPDSDPLVAPGTTIVAWPVVDEGGALTAVEVRDLLGGTATTPYPASGLATNVREVAADHVLLEATAFDPLVRTVGYLDLRDGRFATFEAAAPPPPR